MDETLFAEVPEDLATLDDAALAALVEDYAETVAEVTADPAAFVSGELSAADLIEATKGAVETLKALRAEADSRAAAAAADPPADEPVADDEPAELTDEERAAMAALADDAAPVEPTVDPPAPVAVVASAPPRRARPPRPTASRDIPPAPDPAERSIPLLATAGAPGRVIGQAYGSDLELADAMIERHRQLGAAGPNVQEKYSVARADWADFYPAERNIQGRQMDEEVLFAAAQPVINMTAIKRALRERVRMQDRALTASGAASEHEISIVASGGLCAPVTPYYNLQYISVPVRPVMGSLPSFAADRGGLRYARPAALSAVTTGVGIITEAEDFAGGTNATKTCQTIACPEFQETDVDTIYHCLQFGNLGARVFPELVAQWNNLVLAAHARLAESNLLTQIDAFSTQVVAGSLGLGASASLFSQILVAANGLRNRNRMDPEAVLRLMLPWWAVDLIVSDVIRSQFERFDTDQAKVTALLRSFNVEPTFYIDGANGRGQVFSTQSHGVLEAFPAEVVWYLFPEGSFLYLDSGMLELGIVRDSVLNKTNDFQIFGETFENVAFVGVEALAVASTTCDSGTVSLPTAVSCPINYVHGS